jgi:hypothetical protein
MGMQDRSNIGDDESLPDKGLIAHHLFAGNARVAGLQKDLGLTNQQYQICVTVLYVCVLDSPEIPIQSNELTDIPLASPYIASELPANLILRRVTPKILMPTILTIWGIMVTLQGGYGNYFQL